MSVATATIHDHLADLLGRHQLLPPELASRLVARAVQLNTWLGQVAIDDNLVSERELTQVLAEETDLPVADLSHAVADPAALARLRVAVCREHLVVPLGLQGQTLQVAVANPLEPSLQDLLAARSARPGGDAGRAPQAAPERGRPVVPRLRPARRHGIGAGR